MCSAEYKRRGGGYREGEGEVTAGGPPTSRAKVICAHMWRNCLYPGKGHCKG